MTRVLFVSTSTTLGGAEKTLFTLATRLDPLAFETCGAVSLKAEGPYAARLRERGVPVQSLHITGLPNPREARRLARIIDREKPDVVHALMYQAIQLTRWAKPLAQVPFQLVTSPRVHYRTRSWGTLLLDRWLKQRDDLTIAECEASRIFLIEELGYAPDKVITIRNGVDFSPQPECDLNRMVRRAELGLSDKTLLIGAIGRLDAQKGFDTLIQAMARVKEAAVRCVIIGDGPKRKQLSRLIAAHGLEKSTRLLGEQADATSWLPAFDLYCLPSNWEGLPNSLLEAMAQGLPAVASAIDGVPEVLSDGENGILVPPAQPEALSKALEHLAQDADLRARLGTAAAADIRKRFTMTRMLDDYQNALTL